MAQKGTNEAFGSPVHRMVEARSRAAGTTLLESNPRPEPAPFPGGQGARFRRRQHVGERQARRARHHKMSVENSRFGTTKFHGRPTRTFHRLPGRLGGVRGTNMARRGGRASSRGSSSGRARRERRSAGCSYPAASSRTRRFSAFSCFFNKLDKPNATLHTTCSKRAAAGVSRSQNALAEGIRSFFPATSISAGSSISPLGGRCVCLQEHCGRSEVIPLEGDVPRQKKTRALLPWGRDAGGTNWTDGS